MTIETSGQSFAPKATHEELQALLDDLNAANEHAFFYIQHLTPQRIRVGVGIQMTDTMWLATQAVMEEDERLLKAQAEAAAARG